MILAGDIGGTNTRLGIFDDRHQPVGEIVKIATDSGTSLKEAAGRLIAAHAGRVERACFAVAGPVIDGRVEMTNVRQVFDEHELQRSLDLKRVALINDLVANASGIELLASADVRLIRPGEPHRGNRAVVSPGTGLGEAGLIYEGEHHRPISSEGGHSFFSPTNDLEIALLAFMAERHQTVTWERVLSGPGIENLFEFFASLGAQVSDDVARQLDALPPGKRARVISGAAVAGSCEASRETLDQFIRLLARKSANVALTFCAVGGLYLGGGIPPKIATLVDSDLFRETFIDHETMHGLLEQIPVHLILNDDTALEGAAVYGLRYATPRG